MMPRAARIVLCLTALGSGLAMGAGLASCSEYDSSLLHYAPLTEAGGPDVSVTPEASDDAASEPEAADDAVAEAAVDAEHEADAPDDAFDPYWCDPCKDRTLFRPPCSPKLDDQQGSERLVFAFKTIRFGMDAFQPNDWRNLGVDLDCMNTSADGQPMACKRVSNASVKVAEDGAQGRDNSFGRNIGGLVIQLEMFGLIDNLEVSQNLSLFEGRSGLIAVIENLGPGRDDPTVKFSLYLSRGSYNEEGTEEVLAKWDGNDLWGPDTGSIGINNEPLFATDAAWVTDGTLVAHLPDGLPIEFAGSAATLVMTLNKSVVMFRISEDRQKLSDGLLAGAWGLQAALAGIQGFAAQSGICPDDPQYLPAVQAVSRAPDIRLDLIPRPDLDCNAISIAMGFTAERAKMGKPVAPPTQQHGQCDAGTDAN